MTTYYRLWAPVACDTYREPHPFTFGTAGRVRHVEAAVRSLRRRLEAGETGVQVVLIAPERGTVVEMDRHSQVRGSCHAWTTETAGMNTDASALAWAGATGELVWSKLSANRHTPDSHSQVYAAAGSVRLDRPTLTGLQIPYWLNPVGQHLSTRYQVDVGVSHPQPRLEVAAPVIVQNALTAEQVARMVAHFRAAPKNDGLDGKVQIDDVPEPIRARLFDLANEAGEALGGLRVTHTQSFALAYPPGTQHPRHIDAGGTMPGALARTVSSTVMLSEPGRDFSGGVFVTNEGPAALGAGDFVGFTAVTPHEVTPIETGERVVLVTFGMQLVGL